MHVWYVIAHKIHMVVHQCLWPLFDGLLKKGLFTNVAHLQALEQNSFDWTVVSLWAAKITHLPRRVKTTNLAAESASDGLDRLTLRFRAQLVPHDNILRVVQA